MASIRLSKTLIAAISGVAVVMGVLFVGCSPKPEASAPQEKVKQATEQKTETPAPAPKETEAKPAPAPAKEEPKPKTPEEFLAGIRKCPDMIAWYGVREAYRESGLTNAEIDAALTAKEQQLLEQSPAHTISDELQLVDFGWDIYQGEEGKGKDVRFTASWLFKKTGDIDLPEGHELSLVLRGLPDKSHIEQFPSERYKDEGYFEFTFALDPPAKEWSNGEYYLVTKNPFPVIPNVPYRMVTIMSEVMRNEDGSTRFVDKYGERPQLGWYAGAKK